MLKEETLDIRIDELKEISWRLSRRIIEMTTKAGSGHPSSSLSAIDIMVALYFSGIMRYNPQQPDWPDRDRFILSKGHGVPALYAVLAEARFIDPQLLDTLREIGSPLEGHPNMRAVPGLEASSGSLGQGLSIGLGHALAARLDGRDYRVYVMLGDGEVEEGQVWEASMAAAKFETDNLTALLDYNKFQQTGPVGEVMPPLFPPAGKWRSFGWYVEEIDGHDIEAVISTLMRMKELEDQPQMVICNTLKGKGLSVFEKDDVNRMHGKPLSEEQAESALEELDRMYGMQQGAG